MKTKAIWLANFYKDLEIKSRKDATRQAQKEMRKDVTDMLRSSSLLSFNVRLISKL